jgi:hypothetical protein
MALPIAYGESLFYWLDLYNSQELPSGTTWFSLIQFGMRLEPLPFRGHNHFHGVLFLSVVVNVVFLRNPITPNETSGNPILAFSDATLKWHAIAN